MSETKKQFPELPAIQDDDACNIKLSSMQKHQWYEFNLFGEKLYFMLSPDESYLFIDRDENHPKNTVEKEGLS